MSKLPIADSRWYRQHWLAITFFATGLAAIIFITLAIVMFAAWRSSPEKALADAVNYAINMPGEYHFVASGTDMTLQTDGRRQSWSGTYQDVRFDALVDGNTMYVRSPTPDVFARHFFGISELPPSMTPLVTQLIESVKNRWVSIDVYRLPAGLGTSRSKCLLNGRSQLVANHEVKLELAATYASNKFLTIKTARTTAIDETYTVNLETDKLDNFLKKLATTNFYSSLAGDCTGTLDEIRKLGAKNSDAEVTVTKSDHRLKSVAIGSLRITATDNPVDTISLPADVIYYDTLAGTVAQSLLKSQFKLQ